LNGVTFWEFDVNSWPISLVMFHIWQVDGVKNYPHKSYQSILVHQKHQKKYKIYQKINCQWPFSRKFLISLMIDEWMELAINSNNNQRKSKATKNECFWTVTMKTVNNPNLTNAAGRQRFVNMENFRFEWCSLVFDEIIMWKLTN
jgi:hypothetical protein